MASFERSGPLPGVHVSSTGMRDLTATTARKNAWGSDLRRGLGHRNEGLGQANELRKPGRGRPTAGPARADALRHNGRAAWGPPGGPLGKWSKRGVRNWRFYFA